jgi:hypothetical protein
MRKRPASRHRRTTGVTLRFEVLEHRQVLSVANLLQAFHHFSNDKQEVPSALLNYWQANHSDNSSNGNYSNLPSGKQDSSGPVADPQTGNLDASVEQVRQQAALGLSDPTPTPPMDILPSNADVLVAQVTPPQESSPPAEAVPAILPVEKQPVLDKAEPPALTGEGTADSSPSAPVVQARAALAAAPREPSSQPTAANGETMRPAAAAAPRARPAAEGPRLAAADLLRGGPSAVPETAPGSSTYHAGALPRLGDEVPVVALGGPMAMPLADLALAVNAGQEAVSLPAGAAPIGLAVGDVVFGGAGTEEATDAAPESFTAQPEETDRLAEPQTFDQAALDAALQQFLSRAAEQAEGAALDLSGLEIPAYVAAVAVGAAMFEFGRRYRRRNQPVLALASTGSASTLTWMSGSTGTDPW